MSEPTTTTPGRVKIFLTWSGPESRRVAMALKEWLPLVINALDPWISTEGISKGKRWSAEIARGLDEAAVGIICLTRENLFEPWIHFEAGAISKSKGLACTYLLGLTTAEVPDPLGQFQHTIATDEEDNLKLCRTLNDLCRDRAVQAAHLEQAFRLTWQPKVLPIVRDACASIAKGAPSGPVRSDRQLLEEIVDRVRIIESGVSRPPRPPTKPEAPSTTRRQMDALSKAVVYEFEAPMRAAQAMAKQFATPEYLAMTEKIRETALAFEGKMEPAIQAFSKIAAQVDSIASTQAQIGKVADAIAQAQGLTQIPRPNTKSEPDDPKG